MADEAQAQDIGALFGDEAKPVETQTGGSPSGDEAPREEVELYVEGRLPKQFHRDDGKHDIDGLSKSWFDLRRGHAEQSARVKELEKQLRTSDEPWEAYSADIDWESLKEKAPKAYLGGEVENKPVMALLHRMHQAGIGKDVSRKVLAEYYADLDGMVEAPKTPEERRAEAVRYLGVNGEAMAREVRTWLETQSRARPFTDDVMGVLGGMLQSGPALHFLHELARGGRSTAPPSGRPEIASNADPERERVEARKALGVSDEEWRKNKTAILARYRQAYGEG